MRRQVGEACLELLAEGSIELAPADVAARSGVSRATVYRWWPTKPDLVREALAVHTGHRVGAPDTGTWPDDVHALARRLATFFADPTEVALNAIMASGAAPDFDAIVLDRYAPVFDAWRAMVERARVRSEVRDDVEADTVLYALVSPLLAIPLVFHRRPTRAEVTRLADLVIAGSASS